MKNKLLVIGVLSIGSILMMSNSTNVVAKRGDRTGSPVSSASGCNNTGCHGAGSDVTQVTLLNASNVSVAEYTPGETYTIKTEIPTSASGYGFQAVALLSDNSNAGTSTAKSANVQIETLNSRSYSSQNGGTSTSGVFETTWVAPSAGNGDVTFYATGNAVNKNNTSTGDLATRPASLLVTEKITLSNIDNETEEISIYPNPVENILNVGNVNVKNIQVLDLSGKRVLFSANKSANVTSLESGIYIVKVVTENGKQLTSKIVKK